MCVCVRARSYVYVCVYLCVCLCMSMFVCEITPVNTEKREAPVPSRRAQGEAAAPGAQDSVSPLGSLPSPSPAPALLLQQPTGCKETCCVSVLVGMLFLLTWS